MSNQNKLIQLVLLLCLLGGGNALAVGQTAQTATSAESDNQTVKALLDEVRQLRLVMQRSSVATYRAQITLERLKLQQTRVDLLLKEQTEMRNRIGNMDRQMAMLNGQAIELERLLAAATTPTERSEREMMLKGLRSEIESEKLQLQELREREPQIVTQLQTEQAKLNELNDSLDRLERELESSFTEKGKR